MTLMVELPQGDKVPNTLEVQEEKSEKQEAGSSSAAGESTRNQCIKSGGRHERDRGTKTRTSSATAGRSIVGTPAADGQRRKQIFDLLWHSFAGGFGRWGGASADPGKRVGKTTTKRTAVKPDRSVKITDIIKRKVLNNVRHCRLKQHQTSRSNRRITEKNPAARGRILQFREENRRLRTRLAHAGIFLDVPVRLLLMLKPVKQAILWRTTEELK
ncbi:hypothetical protein MHYP_G00355980 [Metynnis hypsauchen]